MPRPGERYTHDGIVVEIVEVVEYKTFGGRRCYLIGYKIRDGNYESPVAHFWCDVNANIAEEIKKVVEFYKQVRDVIR